MYRIALIQNESEMMRYSWADTRPMIESLSYQYDGYTTENIEELFPKLTTNRYDAIVIASNACNDRTVRQSLDRHQADIESFLRLGKGLLVSFQMKMPNFPYYEFVPEEFRVSAKSRLALGEHPKDGELVIGQGLEGHTILRFPIELDIEKTKRRALTNNLVEGIYWIYLEPHHPENYTILLEDNSTTPARALLAVSREDYPFRIAISALAMDWQKMDELWQNTLRYVVEGRPSIAIITKSGQAGFDFRYLLSSLEINKLPYAEYSFTKIDTANIPLDVHEMYLLDPAWRENEIDEFVNNVLPLVKSGQARVFYFGENTQGLYVSHTLSNVREYQVIARNALTWLVSQFPESSDKGYWDGSFWATVDVLTTLHEFGVPIERFKDKVLNAIKKHDIKGSYDEVLGASCAMLEVYDMFLGRTDPKTLRSLDWIQERVHGKTLFERATAYEVFAWLGIDIPEEHLQSFKNEVMSNLRSLRNEFMLYRYGSTLLSCGFINEAEQVALQLNTLQNKHSGRWVNISNTAAIADFLIELQSNIRNPRSEIDDMIFRGIQYLRSTYTPAHFSWGLDVGATAKSLKALRNFEEKISFPVDFIQSVIQIGEIRARDFTAIDVAAKINAQLQNEMKELTNENQELENNIVKQSKQSYFSTRLASILTVVVVLALIYGLLFIQYLSENDRLEAASDAVTAFTSRSLLITAVPILATVLFIGLILILRRLDRIPDWIEEVVASFIDLRDRNET